MTLRECFDAHRGRLAGKVDHFFDVYEKHLARFCGTDVRVLEIGVDRGGSLELWQKYFGAEAAVHGVDINPEAAGFAPAGCKVHIGSQVDQEFIQAILDEHGPFDVVIDDGSHLMPHQIQTFEMLYPTLSEDGLYICEDAFTSYWQEYGGKLRGADTFMEYAKALVDDLHAFWILDEDYSPGPFTRMTEAIHFYSGAVVFQRKAVVEPVYVLRAGETCSSVEIAELKRIAARQLEKPV